MAALLKETLEVRARGGQREPLHACVRTAVDGYFENLEGHEVTGLYHMVIQEVEVPLIESVLQYTRGNQTHAAEILGISRSTLRKKLAVYGIE